MNSNLITDIQTEIDIIDLKAQPLVNLKNYKSGNYNRGKSKWLVIIWWFVQAIAFPLSLHNFNNFRCWLLRLFGAKIGQGVIIRPT
ncbi:MAG: colanic acid biosynthesis acetyltransferase WcaF, partial [Xenococcus sp. (in: cyanobacteria)]